MPNRFEFKYGTKSIQFVGKFSVHFEISNKKSNQRANSD